MHSLSPVPSTITSYSSSMAARRVRSPEALAKAKARGAKRRRGDARGGGGVELTQRRRRWRGNKDRSGLGARCSRGGRRCGGRASPRSPGTRRGGFARRSLALSGNCTLGTSLP
jgi:hypothetical protein